MSDDNLDARREALKAAGWELTSERPGRFEPVPGAEDMFRQLPGHFILEKYWRGKPVREYGETLEDAIIRAEWQETRISGPSAANSNGDQIDVRTGLDW